MIFFNITFALSDSNWILGKTIDTHREKRRYQVVLI